MRWLVWVLIGLPLLVAVVYVFAAEGPFGLRAEYRREVDARRTASPAATSILLKSDLDALPDPVRRYVHVSGAVGQPKVRDFVVTGRGRIREAADDPWMSFTFTQHNFVHEPSRFFLIRARRGGLPVDVFHAFKDGDASMRVRLLALFQLVHARGPEMTRAETVTLLNDLCVFAPGALIDPAISWEPIDDTSARASYTLGANTVSAVLAFNERGELVDFVSDDRLLASDGDTFERTRWSTPLSGYRAFGPLQLAGRGVGRWHPPQGAFDYIALEFTDIRMNPERIGM